MNKIITILLLITSIASADICNRIKSSTDDFTGKITKSNPHNYSNGADGLTLYKIIDKGVTTYKLSLSVGGSNHFPGLEGLILKFIDGSIYELPEAKLTADYYRGWTYYSLITLTDKELLMLKNKTIEKYRLGIYDKSIKSAVAVQFKEFVNCLVDVKKEQ